MIAARTSLVLIVTACFAGNPLASKPRSYVNDWSQADADVGHTRYIHSSLRPPLSVKWRLRLEHMGYVRPRCIATGSVLYVLQQGSPRSSISAYRAADGHRMWRYDAERVGSIHTGNLLLLPGNRLAADLGKPLVLLDAHTGELVESNAILGKEMEVTAGPVRTTSGNLIWVEGARGKGNRLIGRDPLDARLLLQKNLELDHWPHSAFFPDHVGEFPGLSGWLFLQSGHTLSTMEAGTHRLRGLRFFTVGTAGLVASRDDKLYLVAKNTPGAWDNLAKPLEVLALDRRAMLVWRTPLAGTSGSVRSVARIVVSPDRVVVWDGRVLSAVRRSDGKQAWKTRLVSSQSIATALDPVGMGNYLWVALPDKSGSNRRLACVFMRTGRLLWTMRWDFTIDRIIGCRGSLYLVGFIPGADQQGEVIDRLTSNAD